MAHSGGKIFINSSSGVALVEDVKNVLGSKWKDVGSVCLSDNINMWAKFKPIHFDKLSALTTEDRMSVVRYLIGSEYNYVVNGIVVPRYHGLTTFLNAVKDSTDGRFYSYVRPKGGANSPYRLCDFVNNDEPTKTGYDHEAKSPFSGVSTSKTQEVFKIQFLKNIISDSGTTASSPNIALSDLVPCNGDGETRLSDYYLGAALLKDGATLPLSFINSEKYSVNSELEIPRSTLDQEKKWTIYPFLCSVGDNTLDMWCCPLEGVTGIEYTKQDDFTIYAYARWSNDAKTMATLFFRVKANISPYNKTMTMRLYNVTAGDYVSGASQEIELNLSSDSPNYPGGEDYAQFLVENNGVIYINGTENSYRFDIFMETITPVQSADVINLIVSPD